MNDWIIILSLSIAGMCAASICMVVGCCRRMRQEKLRRLADAIRERDRLALELKHARFEKRTLERVLETKLSARTEADDNESYNHSV